MRSKLHAKRIIVPLALSVVAALSLFVAPAQSSTTGKLQVTEKLSSANPLTSTTIHVSACWTNAQRGDVIELDEQSPATPSWRSVSHATITTAKGCEIWARTSGAMGKYPYRALVRHGRTVLKISPITTERTFGTITGAAFFKGVFGCQTNGTVSTGTQTYDYFCTFVAGSQAQSDYLMFAHPTTCRSLTLSMTATGNATGNPADKSTVVVEIQQDNNTQPAIFVDNELETFTYTLDSHAAALNIWDNPGNSDGDAAYFLNTGSSAVCSSSTGV